MCHSSQSRHHKWRSPSHGKANRCQRRKDDWMSDQNWHYGQRSRRQIVIDEQRRSAFEAWVCWNKKPISSRHQRKKDSNYELTFRWNSLLIKKKCSFRRVQFTLHSLQTCWEHRLWCKEWPKFWKAALSITCPLCWTKLNKKSRLYRKST